MRKMVQSIISDFFWKHNRTTSEVFWWYMFGILLGMDVGDFWWRKLGLFIWLVIVMPIGTFIRLIYTEKK